MYSTENLIQRAYDFASSGRYQTASQVRQALHDSGFPRALLYPLFDGQTFARAIKARIREARGRSVAMEAEARAG